MTRCCFLKNKLGPGNPIRIVLALVCFFCIQNTLCAQFLKDNNPADSVERAIIPALTFNSDVGLVGGGIVNQIDYRGNKTPYRGQQQLAVLASTRGMIKATAKLEYLHTFNTNIRSTYEARILRLFENQYFGIGNDTQFSQQKFNTDFFFFESIETEFNYTGRLPLTDKNMRTGWDFIVMGGISYNQPFLELSQKDFDNFLAEDRPNGVNGGWINHLGVGFAYEGRNDEFYPTEGNHLFVRFRWSPETILSDFNMTELRLEASQFVSFNLGKKITIGNRLKFRHAGGNVPYWQMSSLGGREQLRGFAQNRFLGNVALSYTLEARSWLFRLPRLNSKVGAHLFTDVGRVSSQKEPIGQLFQDFHQTYGFGGAFTLFNPDLIIRFDLGYSEEMTRLYFGFGYLF